LPPPEMEVLPPGRSRRGGTPPAWSSGGRGDRRWCGM
jgi:hypothetical protein